MRWSSTLLLLAACASPRVTTNAPEEAEPVRPAVPASARSVQAPAPRPPAHDGPPGLVVHNPTEVDIEIHAAVIVDVAGEQGTQLLWPHRFDCPEQAEKHVVPEGGHIRLPAPRRAYPPAEDACERGPALPAGDYLLRLDSGYGEELYAIAELTLPLSHTVELAFERHGEDFPCDPTRARRAARLAMARAENANAVPKRFFDGCEEERARCTATAQPPDLPPSRCDITSSGGLLRVVRPAGDDAPRWLTARVDREVTHVRRLVVTRTSASEVQIGGATIVVTGTTTRHRHEHRGDAATVGSLRLRVHNPLARSLRYRIEGVEYLVDHQCGLPRRVRARPRLSSASPKRLAPGTTTLDVAFEKQHAYQAHCDRFATRVRLRLEGHPLAVTSEHEVTRYEPLRR